MNIQSNNAFNILGIHLTSYTMDFYPDVSHKYQRLSALQGVSFHQAVLDGITHIMKNTSIKFHRMVSRTKLSERVSIDSLPKLYESLVRERLGEFSLSFGTDEEGEYFSVSGKRFDLNGYYHEYFHEQSLLIEFVALYLIKRTSTDVHRKIAEYQSPGKENFNMEEAVLFTGYSKSYLYKARSMGFLVAGQVVGGGKLNFKRKDLESFMYRNEAARIDDLV